MIVVSQARPHTRRQRWRAAGALASGCVLLGVASCSSIAGLGGCSDDLTTRVEPSARAVRVGESYGVAASAWGCRGTKRLSDDWRYAVGDTAVARVDSVSGRVTARAARQTDVRARGRVYGEALNPARLTVVP